MPNSFSPSTQSSDPVSPTTDSSRPGSSTDMSLPFQWNPGQHMAIIGMTGSGKSILTSALLDRRKFYVVLKSKADPVKYPQAKVFKTAEAMDDPRNNRIVLRPRFERQRDEFEGALKKAWAQGGWTVNVDETHYVDLELGLRPLLNRLLTQGRSPGKISVVCGMQRPTTVSRFAIGEASHVISFGLEGRDAKILEQAATPTLGKIVPDLKRFHFAWLSIPERRIWVGKMNLGTGTYTGEYVRVGK